MPDELPLRGLLPRGEGLAPLDGFIMREDFHDRIDQIMLLFGPLIGLTLGTVFGGLLVGFAWWLFA